MIAFSQHVNAVGTIAVVKSELFRPMTRQYVQMAGKARKG